MNNPKPETVIKIICAICLGIVLLVVYIFNNRINNMQSQFDEVFDELMDNYTEEIAKRTEAETRYDVLCENLDNAYSEYLCVYFYILGQEDVSEQRAKEAAVYIHDYLDMMRP